MSNLRNLKKVLDKIQIVRPPRHRLATFGSTTIDYFLITEVAGFTDRARVRMGIVTAERPAIITPEALRQQFQGFGESGQNYAEWLINHYGEALRGLEYRFRNEHLSTRIELTPPDILTRQLAEEFDREQRFRNTLIRGTDKMWELSVMKFIVEETLASFASNMRELQEHNFFDPPKPSRTLENRHKEIRSLLQQARTEPAALKVLAQRLKDYGLFDQYQDQFFQLLQR